MCTAPLGEKETDVMNLVEDLVCTLLKLPVPLLTAFLGAPDPYAVEDEDIVMVDRDDIDAPKEGSRGSRHSDRRSRRKVSEDSSDIIWEILP